MSSRFAGASCPVFGLVFGLASCFALGACGHASTGEAPGGGPPNGVGIVETDRARYAWGDTIAATFAYSNGTASTVTAQQIQVGARLADGTAVGTFSPSVASVTVAPGASAPFQESLSIVQGAPTGTWSLYASWLDGNAARHEGPALPITVTNADGGITPEAGVAVDGGASAPVDGLGLVATAKTTYAPGATITGSVDFRNGQSSAVSVKTIILTARPPGATHTSGPFDDFAPTLGPVVVAPGQTVGLTASFRLPADPTGAWELFATWEDTASVYHDGPSVHVTVAP